MKRILVGVTMCLSLVLGATAYTASPAAANDGSDVHCWVGDYYAYSQFWYDNGSAPPYVYHGWWRNERRDQWQECEDGSYYYLGQYSQGYYRCYCEPEWYN